MLQKSFPICRATVVFPVPVLCVLVAVVDVWAFVLTNLEGP
jgi:hypothetical protein